MPVAMQWSESVFAVSGALLPYECAQLCELAESLATQRVEPDSFEFEAPNYTARLWERVRDFVPAFRRGFEAWGIHPRLRFQHAASGERLSGSPVARDKSEAPNLIHCLLFLNDELSQYPLWLSDDDVGEPLFPQRGLLLGWTSGVECRLVGAHARPSDAVHLDVVYGPSLRRSGRERSTMVPVRLWPISP